MRALLGLGVAMVVGGCAPALSAEDPAALARAYREVRLGVVPRAQAGGVQFCAVTDGLEASNLGWRGSDDWADKFRDRWLSDGVARLIAADPALRGEPIEVATHEGVITLAGRVSSDAVAIRATRLALSVDGVLLVNVRLTSPDSPDLPRASQLAYCE